LGAEERGQAEAIAHNLESMASLETPILAVVIGEGGSGGALALGMADRVLMLQHAIYSVISPEGCAAILWNDASEKERAAKALKLTSEDLLELGLVDEIIPEPLGGAHCDPDATIRTVAEVVTRHLKELVKIDRKKLIPSRTKKYMEMGQFAER
jgi:acetyl-CoA carboxylase carboxyl transferase subunit alpha